jgi:hypothetical protein
MDSLGIVNGGAGTRAVAAAGPLIESWTLCTVDCSLRLTIPKWIEETTYLADALLQTL